MGYCYSIQVTTGESVIGEKCQSQTFGTGYPVMAKPLVRNGTLMSNLIISEVNSDNYTIFSISWC